MAEEYPDAAITAKAYEAACEAEAAMFFRDKKTGIVFLGGEEYQHMLPGTSDHIREAQKARRERIASEQLAGLLSCDEFRRCLSGKGGDEEAADAACKYTDALIKKLDEEG